MLQESIDLMYLAACAVKEQVPERIYLEKLEPEKVYRLAKYHTLAAVSYEGLALSGVLEDQEWLGRCTEEGRGALSKWRESRDKAVRKNLLLDVERRRFFSFCEKEHIWYLPLKGSVMKELYPRDGMRQMADNDILFDASCQSKVRSYFEAEGYEVVSYAKGNHDVYQKKPIYNFELHTALFGKEHQAKMVEYYGNVKDRLLADKEGGYGFHFSVEDFYVYMMAHMFKHFDGGGTGIRSLLDIYVYQARYGDVWNRAYLEGELTKLGILEFEQETLGLARELFGGELPLEPDKLPKEEMDRLLFFMGSGTYGTMKNSIEKKLRKLQTDGKEISLWTKARYLFRRVFPDGEWMKEYYPVCRKHPWLIPLCVAYRLVFRSLKKLNKIMREVKTVRKIGK